MLTLVNMMKYAGRKRDVKFLCREGNRSPVKLHKLGFSPESLLTDLQALGGHVAAGYFSARQTLEKIRDRISDAGTEILFGNF
jgi:hypothetical protein